RPRAGARPHRSEFSADAPIFNEFNKFQKVFQVTARAGRVQNDPGKSPPSMRRFCPVMKPALAEHRKAQAAPNSSAVPRRPAGISRACRSACSEKLVPVFEAANSMVLRMRSVSNLPGRMLLIVTLRAATDF